MRTITISCTPSKTRCVVATILFLALWIGAPIRAGIDQWSTGGPYGGEALSIVIDPQTPNVLFAIQNGGGFFRSRNWGQSWELIPGFEWPNPAMSCLVHPTDHRLVLVGTTGVPEGGMSRSTDGGDTWENLHLPGFSGGSSIIRIAVHPEQPDLIYAAASAGYDGLFISADRGWTWSQVTKLEGLFFNDFAMLSAPPYTLFYAPRKSYPDTEHGILMSTDGGSTWQQSFPPTGTAYRLACHPDRPGWIYASMQIGHDLSIYRSTDGGGNWSPLASDIGFQDMAFHPTQPDLIYFIGSGCSRSTDGGETYTRIYPLNGLSVALNRSVPMEPSTSAPTGESCVPGTEGLPSNPRASASWITCGLWLSRPRSPAPSTLET